jgi:hypothetical protein
VRRGKIAQVARKKKFAKEEKLKALQRRKAGLSGELDPFVRCGQLSFELRDSARSKIEENRYLEEVFECPSGREETKQGKRLALDTRRNM